MWKRHQRQVTWGDHLIQPGFDCNGADVGTSSRVKRYSGTLCHQPQLRCDPISKRSRSWAFSRGDGIDIRLDGEDRHFDRLGSRYSLRHMVRLV